MTPKKSEDEKNKKPEHAEKKIEGEIDGTQTPNPISDPSQTEKPKDTK